MRAAVVQAGLSAVCFAVAIVAGSALALLAAAVWALGSMSSARPT